jgi:hypothetical protein
MPLPHRNVLCCIILLQVLFSSTPAKTITAEGLGANQDAAVRCALRAAVERGVGIQLTSQTIVKNFQVVSDKILTHTDGYVTSYNVLSTEQEFGLTKVKVSAEVEMGKLHDELAAQKLIYELVNKPRIMVLLNEQGDGKDMPERTATHKVEEALLKRSFKIIEPEQFKQNQELEKARALNDPDLASLGFRNGADLIIRG